MKEFDINEAKSEFFSKSERKQRKIFKKNQTEALKINALVDQQTEAEKLNAHLDSKRGLKSWADFDETNTEIATIAAGYKELLGDIETINPKISESIDIAEKGLNEIFPESKDRDIRHNILVLPHNLFEESISKAAYLSNRDLEDQTVRAFQNNRLGVVFDFKYMVSEKPFSENGDENFVTIVLHELSHLYSYKDVEEVDGRRIVYDGLSAVSGPISDKKKHDEARDVGLNEHITNYLGYKALLASGSAHKLNLRINKDSPFVRFCQGLDDFMGLDKIKEAYTRGRTEIFKERLGDDYNDFSKALDCGNFIEALKILTKRSMQ